MAYKPTANAMTKMLTERCFIIASSFLVSICSPGQSGVDHGQGVLAANVVDVRDAEHAAELVGGNLHGPWGRCGAWRRLRECSGHRGMESHIAFHFLHGLVDVSVE